MHSVALQVSLLGISVEEFLLLAITAFVGGTLGALPACIFTGIVVFLDEGVAILQRQITGNVEAVLYNTFPAGQPLGGVKQSGNGREVAVETLEEHTRTKTSTIGLD
jgi:acyl-CoA reductase-like NAD-dependent aldehyde dehydrogenase